MIQWFNRLGWLACLIYSTIPALWLMIHSRADYWRSQKRSPYFRLLPAWMAMWIVLGLVTFTWRRIPLYASAWTWIPAIILFLAGLWIYSQSGKQFSHAQLGGLPEILPSHPEHKLVTRGIRRQVRHPIYLAHLCEMLAWSLGTGLVVCYALTALAIVTGAIMIQQEDNELAQRFGKEYEEYRKSTPAILPSMFSPNVK